MQCTLYCKVPQALEQLIERPEEQIVKQQQLNNHREALKVCFATIPGDHLAVVESTTGWYWLRDLLDQHGASRRHRSGNKDGNRYLKMAFCRARREVWTPPGVVNHRDTELAHPF